MSRVFGNIATCTLWRIQNIDKLKNNYHFTVHKGFLQERKQKYLYALTIFYVSATQP